jgi:hypothetical protein
MSAIGKLAAGIDFKKGQCACAVIRFFKFPSKNRFNFVE